MADSFKRLGFKTEARLLKTQGDQVVKLIDKAIEEMPALNPLEGAIAILSGGMSPTFKNDDSGAGTSSVSGMQKRNGHA